MSEVTSPASPDGARASELSRVKAFFSATEIDTRMLGMIGALVLIWLAFQFLSGWRITGNPLDFGSGVFLTPRNLWNLSVQTSSVAVMATGMVLVIVTRNIDLSIGSLLGFVAMIMGVVQAEILPQLLGYGSPVIWIAALVTGVLLGVVIGGLHGYIIAYLGVPSFIVTLGGLLIWRGGAWWVTSGRTVAPMDPTFRLMGGGPQGAIGFWPSWILGAVACVAVLATLLNGRAQRKRFNFPRRPVWAEVFLGVVVCAVIMGAVAVANSYPWPIGVVRSYYQSLGQEVPQGGAFIPHGIAIPVLIAIFAGLVMTFVTTRTSFGRYVFAIGGNPEAAELAGINTRWVTMKIFMVMGGLAAISGAISTARLNAATNVQGTLDELLVIAAAVIGGTSLAGGVGTVFGAMLGALLMQSLQSGMVLLGIDTPLQNIVVGAVLVFAVWLDTVYRKRVQ